MQLLSPGPDPLLCRLYAFTDDTGKTKPGMVTVVDGSGSAVYLEVWEMPIENFGHFILQVCWRLSHVACGASSGCPT